MKEQKKFIYSDTEFQWIKSVFSGDDDFAIKMIRKIFYPQITEDANPGQNINMYSLIQTEGKTAEEIAVDVMAMNKLLAHVERQIQVLKALAGKKEESVEEMKARLLKDSSK